MPAVSFNKLNIHSNGGKHRSHDDKMIAYMKWGGRDIIDNKKALLVISSINSRGDGDEKKENVKQKLGKQQEENRKELQEISIHFVSLEEHQNRPDQYRCAIVLVPTCQPGGKWKTFLQNLFF